MINAPISERAQIRAHELLTRYEKTNGPALLLNDVRSNRISRGEFILAARALAIGNHATRRAKLAQGLTAYTLVFNQSRSLMEQGRALREAVVIAMDAYRYYRFNGNSLEYAITKEGNCEATSEFSSSLELDLKPYSRERIEVSLIYYTNHRTSVIRINDREETDMQSGGAPYEIHGRIAGTRIRAQDYEMLFAAEHGLPHQLPEGVRIERGDGVFAHVIATDEYPDPGIIRARHSIPLSNEVNSMDEFADYHSTIRQTIRRIVREEILSRAIIAHGPFLRNSESRYFSNGVPQTSRPIIVDFVTGNNNEINRIIEAKEKEVHDLEGYLDEASKYHVINGESMHVIERVISLARIVALAETLKSRVANLPAESSLGANYDTKKIDEIITKRREEAIQIVSGIGDISGQEYLDYFMIDEESLLFLGRPGVQLVLKGLKSFPSLVHDASLFALLLPSGEEDNILQFLDSLPPNFQTNILSNSLFRSSTNGIQNGPYISFGGIPNTTDLIQRLSHLIIQRDSDGNGVRFRNFLPHEINELNMPDEIKSLLLNGRRIVNLDFVRIIVDRLNLRERSDSVMGRRFVQVVDAASSPDVQWLPLSSLSSFY